MKSLLTVSGVVFAHICVFLLLVNGCSSGSDAWRAGDTSVYSGGARSSRAAEPASATPEISDDDILADEPVPAEPVAAVPEESEPSAAKPASANDGNAETVYIVKKGDTLSMIAVRNGITPKEIADANGIKLDSLLKIGTPLKIPAAKPKAATPSEKKTAGEGDVYVVQKGDSLSVIAQKRKTTVAKLKEANNLKDDKIKAGQKLVIPGKAEKKTAAAEQPKTEAAPAEASATEKPAESPAPAEPVPAAAPEEPATQGESVPEDENFGMPEGGFARFGDSSAAPAESVPAEGVPAE